MLRMPRRDDAGADEDAPVPLTGVEVFSRDREQLLEVLRLNRKILHEPQPDAEVDVSAVRRAIDRLLDQLTDLS